MWDKNLIEIFEGVNELIVSSDDLNDYYKTSNKRSRIMLFKRYIVNVIMSNTLKQEFTHKFNDLIVIDFENNIYKFETLGASKELKEFLDQFSITLVNEEAK